MAALQSALRYLGPVTFSDIPQSPNELDHYLGELFAQAQTVVESIPIADPDASNTRQSSHTTTSTASNASEMSTSSARSSPPAPQYQALQKEWGKPLRMNKNDNQLGISVYKLGGKDGRGAWFARRSVHEGLGFARFKRAFEAEFPTSLAVQGAPGEGNIRGIGAETMVEDIDVPHRGKVEVYRLSAQFPGPTTPRDFVTMLVTSSRAMKYESEAGKVPDLAPRHYMIISKPCNHPETQPRDGFIRGQYESVEFIREIPRKFNASHSAADLSQLGHKHGHNLEQDLQIRNAEKHSHATHEESDRHRLRVNTSGPNSRELSPLGRKRSHTVQVPESPSRSHDGPDDYDPEENPVEWIMVTRSDPGGSVPRFLVERGTPASICADAVKFLDWACGLQENGSPETPLQHTKPFRRESFTSWHDAENKEHLTGIEKTDEASKRASTEKAAISPTSTKSEPPPASAVSTHFETPNTPTERTTSPGILSSAAGVISTYTPQAVLDQLPHRTPKLAHVTDSNNNVLASQSPDENDDAASTLSSTSFASADSHLGSLDIHESNSITSHSLHDGSSTSTQQQQPASQHEKELAKLSQRRSTLDAKFAGVREKLALQASSATEKEQQALKKAEERHERELKKHQEKYDRELAKIEARKKKEAKKMEERRKKQADKDEKARLTRERDEAVAKVELLEKEREVWLQQVGELQKENTSLMTRIGKLEGVVSGSWEKDGRPRGITIAGLQEEEGTKSRSSSMLGRKKDKATLERVGTGLGSEASGHSGAKSDGSSQGS